MRFHGPWTVAILLGVGGCGDAAAESGDGGAPDKSSNAGDAGSTGDAGGDCLPPAEPHEGEGTFYDADGSGNCSFPASPDDLMVAAMNETDYAGSAVCGACARVAGPDGEVTVRIVDRCPECAPGDVDLSAESFARIADPVDGRVAISWRFVPCELSGPIAYHFKDGSNPWWAAVQVRNHRHRIDRFEYRADDGSWVEVARANYNYFVEAAGMGPGPYDFRVTDVWGNVLEDTGIPLSPTEEIAGGAQLPACAP